MEILRGKIEKKLAELDQLILEISAKAANYRHHPVFHIGDKLDKTMIWVMTAKRKLQCAIDALR